MRKRMSVAVFAALLSVLVLPVTSASADSSLSYRDIVDMTFPVPPEAVWEPSPTTWETKSTHFHYDAKRSSTRYHQSIDLMVPYGTPVYAAMSGTISWMPFDRSYYMIRIAGDDGRVYDYVHLGHDNDPPSKAYAPGLERGVRVERGQLLGWAGCSGSASCTTSGYHLHFSVEDPNIIDDPYWPNEHYDNPRLDPYPSLRAALMRGDVPGGVSAAGGSFTDVWASNVHFNDIEKLVEAGLTKGCGGSRFCPGNKITRGEMATFLVRALGLPVGDVADFSDVPSSHIHTRSIAALAEAGITKGCGGGRFCPDAPVTREQMASFLVRAKGLSTTSGGSFSDVSDTNPHRADIATLAAAGITKGCGGDRFCPAAPVLREQMASFLVRAFLNDV